ncbi:MAG: aminoacyl-tRNA hydrolase [Prevotellaceae bacterium]|jgi:PTH1 family peptidyl-tRNA hydrolase|nr:aminoacyl-tRNA hydrolase [Prevotellaceae bacterium]
MNYLIVGLGNIGEEYADTRHNIGFMVLDAWAKASNAVFTPQRYAARTDIKFKGRTFMLVKPSTYMNLSGKAVNYWMQAERVPLENVLVVVDDLALPFGKLRLRPNGSDGGHNGLKHISETFGHQNYARLRLGIGNAFLKGQQIDYVLGAFDEDEKNTLPPLLDRAVEMVKSFATIGMERTMTLFNSTANRG